MLRAPRDIPPPDAVTPPVLITAYDGDPLQPHLDRLGAMPAGWAAHPVATPAEHHAASLAFLNEHPAPAPGALGEATGEGFLHVATDRFDGLVHWRGRGRGDALRIHAPGRALAAGDGLAIDLPGHGLSSGWPDEAPTDWAAWEAVIAEVAGALDASAVAYDALPIGDPGQLYPTFAPDRFGAYLITAWSIVRAGHLFEPWYAASAMNARAFAPSDLAPEALAQEHRDLLRASAARAYHVARASHEGDS